LTAEEVMSRATEASQSAKETAEAAMKTSEEAIGKAYQITKTATDTVMSWMTVFREVIRKAEEESREAREAAEAAARAAKEAIDRAEETSREAKKSANEAVRVSQKAVNRAEEINRASAEARETARKAAKEATTAWNRVFENLAGGGLEGMTEPALKPMWRQAEPPEKPLRPLASPVAGDEAAETERPSREPEGPAAEEKPDDRKAGGSMSKPVKKKIASRLDALARMYASGTDEADGSEDEES
jgi:hypothetical protein